jgi:membrane protein DedA with SNARE-associated domain
VFLSLLLPATAILLGVGGLIGAADIGCCYSYAITRVWPLSRRPDLLPRGEAFFKKWGTFGVFVGRFFGPLRSVMPLVAGICGMRQLPFQIANLVSAVLWATGVLTPGIVALEWLL